MIVQRTLADRIGAVARRSARARARGRRRRPRGARRGSGRRADREGRGARVGRAARRSTPPTPDVDGPAVGPRARSSTPAARPARRRAACSATTTTRRSSRQIGICWERTADDVVWTPLPLFHYNALVTAVLGSLVFGGRGRDLPAVLGVELLARDEPRRRDHHVDARHDGVPARPRHRPARDAELGRARGEHDACGCSAPRRSRSRSTTSSASASASRRSAARTALTEASLVSWQPPGVRNKPNAAGVVNDEYFDVRIFDDDDNEVPPGERRRDRRPTEAAARDVRGLLGSARGDRRDEPQLVVPHRRHRPHRRRRLPVLRRPQGRLPPPPRREHLELRGRERAHGPRRARRRRRARGAERDDRGRPQDHRDAEGRRVDHRGGAVPLVHRPAARTSRCRATSSSAPSCRAARSAACSSASCATKA